MSSKKGAGTVKGNKDSISKRLGVKRYDGETVSPGYILVRQKGNKIYPGAGVKQGNDFTLFSLLSGKVKFKKRLGKKVISVTPS